MSNSILTSTKKALGIDESYTVFDPDIVMHINSVLSTLNQLGIGPEPGFFIENATPTWTDFLGSDPRFNSVKSYLYLKVRLIFDPPATSFTITAMKELAQELEWRMLTLRESTVYIPTNVIVDGGDAIAG